MENNIFANYYRIIWWYYCIPAATMNFLSVLLLTLNFLAIFIFLVFFTSKVWTASSQPDNLLCFPRLPWACLLFSLLP